ncbi:MAG: ABC transporter permease [Candidatus Kariarchaeaceae archaeon]|jgi:peptide/nickel transport system permease protein
MKYRNYVIKRLILLIPMLFGISFITWYLSDIAGDPLAPYVSPNQLPLPEELEAELRERYGLNRPWPVRYMEYMLNLLSGDWGNSYALGNRGIPVMSRLQTAFPASIELGLTAMVIALIVGVPAGIYTARTKRPKLKTFVNGVSITGMAIPSFLLAIIVQYLIVQLFLGLGRTFHDSYIMNWAPYHYRYNIWQLAYPRRILFGLLPTTGFLLIDSLLAPDLVLFIDGFFHLITPALIIAVSQILIITRITRNAMVEVLKEDYILLAKAKGLPERIIIYRHALKNAAIQVTTIVSLVLANLLSGVIFVEVVFSWPGLGTFMLAGVKSLDMPTINGFVVFSTLLYVFINLAVDILYGLIDPRIRT